MFGKSTVNSDQDHISVKDFRPDDTIGLFRGDIEEKYKKLHDEFEELQEKLHVPRKHALLIVLQEMDRSGKDGTVRKALPSISPNGFYVENLKVPTPLELNHDHSWRVHQKTPKRGGIVVFNRLYYGGVFVTRVHRTIDNETTYSRFDEICELEKYLVNNDTILLKFFLYISKDFQQRKLEERLETPEKNWKFSAADLKERCLWDEYQYCYSDVLSHCSTKETPWYVAPANHQWFRDYFMLNVIVKMLEELLPEFPAIDGGVRELTKEVKNNKQFRTVAGAMWFRLQQGCALFF